MSTAQVLYFCLVTVLVTSAGILVLVPVLGKGDFSRLTSRLMLAFAAKMIMGAASLIVAWKLFGWSPTVSAFGSIGAYLVALAVTIIVALGKIKRSSG